MAHQLNRIVKYVFRRKIHKALFIRAAHICKQRLYNPVTHCIFDCDGTLLDSESMFHKIVAKVCKKYNKIYTEELQEQMIGLSDHDVAQTLVQELSIPVKVKDFETELVIASEEKVPNAPILEGVERLLFHFRDKSVPMALCTNSMSHTIALHESAKPLLFGVFHHKVCVTDPEAKRPKPFPDMFLLTASRFPDKPKPNQCLVFEDSCTGVDAAKAAKMQVVLISKEAKPATIKKATVHLLSMKEFNPEWFCLPPFEKNTHTMPKQRS